MEKVLSIVIPAYNVEKYLEKCLSSFEIEAVLDRIEILVINDGSGDHTAEIAQRYCENIRRHISFIIRKTVDMDRASIMGSVMPQESILKWWMGTTG